MRTSAWLVEADRPQQPELDEAGPGLVSLHFLRHALRRRWRAWVGCAVLGMVLGAAAAVALPGTSSATVTLLLAQPVGADPSMAMNTDVSLLRTRTVAEQGHRRPGPGPGARAAPELGHGDGGDHHRAGGGGPGSRRAGGGASHRRHEQGVPGLPARDHGAPGRCPDRPLPDAARGAGQAGHDLHGRSTRCSAAAAGRRRPQASEVLTRRAQVAAQISELEQEIERTRITTGAVIGASGVLDPTSPVVGRSALRTTALDTTAGLIVGASVGVGWVLLAALLSQRVRRREDVALALGTSVRCSVGRLPGRLPGLAWSGRRRQTALDRLVDALRRGLRVRARDAGPPGPGLGPERCRDRDGGECVRGRAGAARAPGARRRPDRAGAPRACRAGSVVRRRPRCGPATARGACAPSGCRCARWVPPVPRRASRRRACCAREPSARRGRRPRWCSSWSTPILPSDSSTCPPGRTSMVLVVTAGRSTAERLRTTAELVRSAGLGLSFVVMVGADHHDESLGSRRAARGRIQRSRARDGAVGTVSVAGTRRAGPARRGPVGAEAAGSWSGWCGARSSSTCSPSPRPPPWSRSRRSSARLLTQGALPLALLLVVVANRRGVVRPQLFLVLLTLMAIGATRRQPLRRVLRSRRPSGPAGWCCSSWRCGCSAPCFGRRDLLLLRCTASAWPW